MFDDFFNNKKNKNIIKKETSESIIESMRNNIEDKMEIIRNLITEVTEREKKIEELGQELDKAYKEIEYLRNI